MFSLTFAIIIVIFFFSSRVIAVPTDHIMQLLSDRREVAISGATSYQVIAWIVAEAIFFLFVLGCYGLRAKTLKLFRLASLNFSRCLLHIIFISSLAFLVSVLVSGLGWGMHKDETCLAAIEVCLVFYLGGKVILYIFLMERVHALRKGYYPRSKDRLWQTCFFFVISCFGEIAVICFFYPVASVEAGYCTIGLRTYITLPMLIFDIACNLTVSWIFYRFAKDQFPTFFHAFIDPDVAWFFRRIGTMFRCSGGVIGIDLRHQPAKASETIVAFITRKTLFSSVAILFSTAVNLGLLFHYNGAEHGWLCWLMCSMDIVWNTGWVTFVTALPTHDETIDTANYINRREEFNFENTGSNNPQPRSVIELEEYPPRGGTARTTAASENSSTRPLRPTFRH